MLRQASMMVLLMVLMALLAIARVSIGDNANVNGVRTELPRRPQLMPRLRSLLNRMPVEVALLCRLLLLLLTLLAMAGGQTVSGLVCNSSREKNR
jgi:hypothetical protein